MYVDLNPIRAGIADSLQSSDFTSIQEIISLLDLQDGAFSSLNILAQSAKKRPQTIHQSLAKFDGSTHLHQQTGIPFHFADYLELIDWTGRAIRHDKKGYIDNQQPKLLNELGITPDAWLTSAKKFRRQYSGISGRWDSMCEFKNQHNSGKWCKGKASSQTLHP